MSAFVWALTVYAAYSVVFVALTLRSIGSAAVADWRDNREAK